jgi:antitoxin component of RelBE/YafQ-DinJ toxin-antitoxin module
MTKQLNIRNDEVYLRAHRIAANLGKSLAEAMLIVLRQYESGLPELDELTPSQRDTYEMLRRLTREAAKHKLPDASSDHDDLYDEFGLPK